ncbi:uncharacterized protein LOC131944972 [Physella acuta]|uniref:uncharacterized protein LOC131944972 n=1 Tax=Physella acuta TaxID=109671 RepID=UPI0027DC30DB|nr:uncharacterized protein LOC131944972 [Physella acuta]
MMPYVDLSFEGRQLAERNQLDNGRLPHGGYRGSKKFPPSLLSCEKGVEFQHSLVQEVQQILRDEAIYKCGPTPTWSLLVHKEPAYTDESPLMTNDFLAANKIDQSSGGGSYPRGLTSPTKCAPPVRNDGVLYYRPNRMHQYLSATELRNSAQSAVNIQHGRPTRTTLLRARNRSVSAPVTIGRDYHQRLEEIRHSSSTHSHQISGSPLHTQYFQLQTSPGDESFYSFLTGARYNRAHCLDSKSVDHSGVYMPRHNPAFGCFYRGPKGQWYLQELEDSLNDSPVNSPNRSHHQQPRPTSVPIHPRASNTSHDVGTPTPTEESLAPQGTAGTKMAASPRASNAKVKVSPRAGHSRRSRNRANLSFNIVGQRVPISGVKLPVLGKVKETPPETETLTPQPARAQEMTSRVTCGGRQGSATSERLEISVLIEEEEDDKVEDDKVEDDKVEDDKVDKEGERLDGEVTEEWQDETMQGGRKESKKTEEAPEEGGSQPSVTGHIQTDELDQVIKYDDNEADLELDQQGTNGADLELDQLGTNEADLELDQQGTNEADLELDQQGTNEADLELDQQGTNEADLELDQQGTNEADLELDQQGKNEADLELDQQGTNEADLELDQQGTHEADLELDQQGTNEADLELDQQGTNEADLELDQQGTNEADLELDQQETNEDDMEQIHQRLADEDNLDKKADEKRPENDKSDENAVSQEDVLFFVTEKDGVQEPDGELNHDSGEQQ